MSILDRITAAQRPPRPDPTDEQLDILNGATTTTNPLMIKARAGTGKTATLEMIDADIAKRPHLYLVFNKKNQLEAERKLASTTTVKTFNGLGAGIWRDYCSTKLNLDTKKKYTLWRGLLEEIPRGQHPEIWACWDNVQQGIELARALGYVPEGRWPSATRLCTRAQLHLALDEDPTDLESDLIDVMLIRIIEASFKGFIDFNDQLYMPALFGGTFPKFPVLLVDEYQDLSPINHYMIAKMTSSRLIGVGDDAQAIYGFRGAHAGGMDEAISTYSMSTFELSVSFRCPSEIVNNVRWRVPNFTAFRQGGSIDHPTSFDLATINPNGTVICRNNAPLMRAAFGLLASGHSVTVSGTDIGPKLIATMRKLGDESLSQQGVLDAISEWLAHKLDRGSSTAPDFAECMRVFAKHGKTLGTAISYAEHIFRSDGTVTLTTGHKAKGLEWDHVYHLDNHIIRDHGQDRNIRYVIDTRSKDRLTYIDSDTIEWPNSGI